MNRRLLFLLAVSASGTLAQVSSPGVSVPAVNGITSRPPQSREATFSGTRASIVPAIEPLETTTAVVGGTLGFLNPSLTYDVQYGDAVPSAPGRQRKTTIQSLSPSVRAQFAERITLTYTPTFNWYSNDAFTDQLGQYAILRAAGVVGETDMAVSQSYAHSNDVLLETAQQTKQEEWVTNASASYSITERTQVFGSASYQLRNTEEFADSETTHGSLGFRHKATQQLNLGLSAGAGYTSMSPGPGYQSQDLTVDAQWTPGSRLTLDFSIGAQSTRFRVTNSSSRISPNYNLRARYKISESTSLILNASRSSAASYFSSQLNDRSRVSLGLSQRFLERLFLSFSASETDTDYVNSPTTSGTTIGRVDTGRTYQASVSTTLRENLSLSLTWQYSQYRSNRVGYTFDTSMIGATAGWRF